MSVRSEEFRAFVDSLNNDQLSYINDCYGNFLRVVSTRKVSPDICDKILIQIPSYEDPLLLSTVKSAVLQADIPDRLHFAICYQDNDITVLQELMKIDNCQIICIAPEDAHGLCYARNLCQHLLSDEKYILHIDAHMRFIKHWDIKLCEQLDSFNDPMGFISTYPSNLSLDQYDLPLDDHLFDEPFVTPFMRYECFRDFTDDIELVYDMVILSRELWHNVTYRMQPMIGGCFLFGYSDMDRRVLSDPYSWFVADEISMSIRYYTHGYNNYRVELGYVYHTWNKVRKSPSPVISDKQNRLDVEGERFRNLVGLKDTIDLGEFGHGSVRTIADFEEYAGVDFKKHIVLKRAARGEFGSDIIDSNRCTTVWSLYEGYRDHKASNMRLHVLIIDTDGHAQDCLDNLKSTSLCNDIDYRIISNFDDKTFSSSVWQGFDAVFGKDQGEFDENDYLLLIFSHIRLVDGWYNYYMDVLSRMSSSDLLTCRVVRDRIDEYVMGQMPLDVQFTGELWYTLPRDIDLRIRYKNVVLNNENIDHDPVYKFQAWLNDGFLFGGIHVFYNMIKDRCFSYRNFLIALAVRLYTMGYDLYYSDRSYAYFDKILRLDDFHNKIDFEESYYISCLLKPDDHRCAFFDESIEPDLSKNLIKRGIYGFYSSVGYDFKYFRCI